MQLRRVHLVAGVAVMFALVALAVSTACSERLCTLVGCSSSLDIEIHLALPASDVQGATLSLCVNADCGSAVMPLLDAGFGTGDRNFLIPPFPLDDLTTTATDDGTRISLTHRIVEDEGFLEPDSEVRRAHAVDGDVYRVEIVLPNGDIVIDRTFSAAYPFVWYPNGPDCDDRPCRRGSVAIWQ